MAADCSRASQDAASAMTKAQSQTSSGIRRRISSNRCLEDGERTHGIPAGGYGAVSPPRPKQAGTLRIGGHDDLGTNLSGSAADSETKRADSETTRADSETKQADSETEKYGF